jgi:hypothetical protein
MAIPSLYIVKVLRNTADRILESGDYQWGHMGACNCGHLAQEITLQTKAEIHKRAMYGIGDWNDQLNDYCPTSGFPFDDVVAAMLDMGFDIDDLKRLERLSDKNVLDRLPFPTYLKHNVKEDVAIYITLWADMLEEQLEKKEERMKKFNRAFV